MLGNVPFAELITFTRASAAWRFNASGILVQDAINVARFDTDPVTLQPRGMLVEEARTNYALWCRDLTNAAWTKSNCTAAKTSTGIDGVVNSSSTLTATAPNGTCLQAITRSSAQRITGLYIRRRTGSGVVNMTQNGGSTWTPVTVTGVFTLVSVPAATAANPSIGLQIVTSGDAIDVDFVSHEEGGYLTSPILTTTAAAARSADVASIATSKIGINPTEGTLYVEAMVGTLGNATNTLPHMAGLMKGNSIGAGDYVGLRINQPDSIQVNIGNIGVFSSPSVPGGVTTVGAIEKLAVAGQGASIVAARNGAVGVALTSRTWPADVDTLWIGSQGGTTRFWNGWIRALRYHPRRLSNAELQALTS